MLIVISASKNDEDTGTTVGIGTGVGGGTTGPDWGIAKNVTW
jgi:hypothetical protein